ncbi:hypothetical protein ACHAXA_005422 [Cyclostephanos tholiformis]|uniref:Chromosome segregation in meiosis protein 3 domain-containing protein n=1 Tax=Cyclostephanos tholiformis TaxID=382380 RepID=A0ABD3R887_9STRA
MSSYATANRPAASHYSRYDDDDLDSEEEEEERRLSEQYGEAADSDGGGPNRKRGPRTQTNTALTEEDAAAAKEFEETVRPRKVQRPTLQPSDLKGARGLIFVRRSFPSRVARYRQESSRVVRGAGVKSNELARKMNVASQINAAARYSRSLMGAYRDFARELAPSLAAEDAFLKIEDLGSKKDVKDYLQLMRDEFRKEYLTGIYGEEKAARILNELEHGLRASQRPAEDDEFYGASSGGGERSSVAPRLGFAVSNDEDTPPAAVPIMANPYTRSTVETISSAQAFEDDVDSSLHVFEDTSAGMVREDDDVETDATFTANVENDINITNAHISAELPLDKGEGEDCDASTAAPIAAGDVGIEATALEANGNDYSVDEPMTKENELNVAVVDQQFDLDEVNGNAFVDVNLNDDYANGKNLSNKSQVLTVDDKTQETLTLLESQIGNYDEYSQDERFSQVSIKFTDEAPTQIPCSQGDRFSQTQDDRFSQGDNTADERFSQITQTMFDVDVEINERDAGD